MWPYAEATEDQRGLVRPQKRQQMGWQGWGIRRQHRPGRARG